MADNSFSGQEAMIFVESALVLEVGRLITVSVVRKITRVKPSKVDEFSVFVVLHVTTLPQEDMMFVELEADNSIILQWSGR
jgi:hypothetical protein